jgi:hypothetical protein
MSLGLAELHAGKKRKKGNNISKEEWRSSFSLLFCSNCPILAQNNFYVSSANVRRIC